MIIVGIDLFRYKEAFSYFVELKDVEIFEFIDRRLLYREDWITDHLLDLMKLDR